MTCPSQLFPIEARRRLCTGAMLKSGNKESFPLLIPNTPFTSNLSKCACKLYQQSFVLWSNNLLQWNNRFFAFSLLEFIVHIYIMLSGNELQALEWNACIISPFHACGKKVVETAIHPKGHYMAQQIPKVSSLRIILLVKITDKKIKPWN